MYGGLFEVIDKLNIKNIIIPKQKEESDNYKKIEEHIKKRKINISIIGIENNNIQKLQISKDIYFDFLWPSFNNQINKNILNNNSIVCKLNYKSFSCIFTGDIEKEAENEIIKKYCNNLNVLKADILKVAHHGSKTSSTEEFIKICNPKISIIGVGKNNIFGHPNYDVIKRLTNINSKIFRTDLCGEIIISVNYNGRIKINQMLK